MANHDDLFLELLLLLLLLSNILNILEVHAVFIEAVATRIRSSITHSSSLYPYLLQINHALPYEVEAAQHGVENE